MQRNCIFERGLASVVLLICLGTLVLDQQGQPVAGATVEDGAKRQTTDENLYPSSALGNRFQDRVREGKVIWARKVGSGTIKVDGNLDDWEDGKWTVIDEKSSHLEVGTITDKADLSGRLQFAWDKKWLYVALKVNDSDVRGPFGKDQMFKNDGAELWFDFKMDSPVSFMLSSADDYQIVVNRYTKDGKPRIGMFRHPDPEYVLSASSIAAGDIKGGYVIEARFPLDGLNGFDGQCCAFNISLRDLDKTKSGILVWSGKRHSVISDFGLLAFRPLSGEQLATIVASLHSPESTLILSKNHADGRTFYYVQFLKKGPEDSYFRGRARLTIQLGYVPDESEDFVVSDTLYTSKEEDIFTDAVQQSEIERWPDELLEAIGVAEAAYEAKIRVALLELQQWLDNRTESAPTVNKSNLFVLQELCRLKIQLFGDRPGTRR